MQAKIQVLGWGDMRFYEDILYTFDLEKGVAFLTKACLLGEDEVCVSLADS